MTRRTLPIAALVTGLALVTACGFGGKDKVEKAPDTDGTGDRRG